MAKRYKRQRAGFIQRTAAEWEKRKTTRTHTRQHCYDEGLAIDLRYDAGFYAPAGPVSTTATYTAATDLFSAPFVGSTGDHNYQVEPYDDAGNESAPVYGTGELEDASEPSAIAASWRTRAQSLVHAMDDDEAQAGDDAEASGRVYGAGELEEETDDNTGESYANTLRRMRRRSSHTFTGDAQDTQDETTAYVYGAGELETDADASEQPALAPVPLNGKDHTEIPAEASASDVGALAQATNAFGWEVGASHDPDTLAFESDLKDILSGQKEHPSTTSQQAQTQPHDRDDEEDDAPSSAPSSTQQNMQPHASSFTHDDFDQWGVSMGMSNPTTYNMGRFSLSKQFESFDREIDAGAHAAQRKRQDDARAQSFALATDEVAADVDAIFSPSLKPVPVPVPVPVPAPATPARATRAMDALNLRFDVPLVPQQTGMSCWAAGCAMLVGWRDQMSLDPSEIARASGHWAQYQAGLAPEDTSVFPIWGMAPEVPQSYAVQGFYNLLDRYGPLWVASAEPGAHIRVVTGMSGDGSPDGTMLYINDPWEQGMSEFRLPNAGAIYTETYTTFVRKQDDLARREIRIPGAIYVAHLNQMRQRN